MNKVKKNIEAIHEHDLEELLKNLGFSEKFKQGNIKCKFCQNIIKKDNIGAIYVLKKEILFSCSKMECLTNLSEK